MMCKVLLFFPGYGFSLLDFVRIWSKKISIPEKDILSKLFTDSYFSKGMIKEGAECLGKKTLFEQFILQPLWDVHKSGLVDEDLEKLKVYFYFFNYFYFAVNNFHFFLLIDAM